jgi:WD40 repeat protein
VSSDNKYLASGDENKLIYVWDAATMTRIHVFRGHRDVISGLVFRKGTHTLYSCSFDRQEGISEKRLKSNRKFVGAEFLCVIVVAFWFCILFPIRSSKEKPYIE